MIWDWNGTLFDDPSLCVDIMSGMLRKRNLASLDEDRYRQLFTFPVRDYYTRLGFDLEREAFSDLSVEFHHGFLERWRERPLRFDARHVSDALHQRGVTQSVLSAAEQRLLDDCANYFGLTERMTDLVGIDDYEAVSKLDQGLAFLERLRVPIERVLFVGDTVHDHEVASAMGADCALVEGGHATRAKLVSTGTPVFGSLTAMLKSLD